MTNFSTRRAFLQRTSLLPLVGATVPFAQTLVGIQQASAATAADYKALVCVFLYGGNDHFNTLVPYDSGRYGIYQSQRPVVAIKRDALAGTVLNPITPLPSGAQYALAPSLAGLLRLFDAGKLAVMLNVGTLVQPTTKDQLVKGAVAVPPKLMSHNDQQSYWQAGGAEGMSDGWGGRLGDRVLEVNNGSALTCINLSANAPFLSGREAVPYALTPDGAIPLDVGSLPGGRSTAALVNQLIAGDLSGTHVMHKALAATGKRSLDLYDTVSAALARAPATRTPFPNPLNDPNRLGDQLKMVAKLISVGQGLGLRRQVFMVSATGFDTHDGLNSTHPALLRNLGDALTAFYDTTVELGLDQKVTTFTASDFGRALRANNDGSDHGWGSMHFVLGGAVNGKQYYGINPTLGNNGPDDIGAGRLIPTMSVDQYGATMAKWFGVSDDMLPTIFPHLPNFKRSPTYPLDTDLGFMGS